MIFTTLGPLAAYRMHMPKWAATPASGAGAATHGGRANRPGTHALYLALEPVTAIREYQQASTLLPPGTLVSYTVELSKVVDFRGGLPSPATGLSYGKSSRATGANSWFNQGIEPPSWVLADEAIAASATGVLFASTVEPGGTNLVIYTQRLGPLDRIEVHDPARALPKNQDSWR